MLRREFASFWIIHFGPCQEANETSNKESQDDADETATGKGRLRPSAPEWWTAALAEAGFENVRYEHVVSEAGVVTATAP